MDFPDVNWGSLADWASAFGSVFAAGTALYLARESQRIRLSVTCGIRVQVQGQMQTRLVSIYVANTGGRPVKVSAISLRHGFFKKNEGIIKLDRPTEFTDPLFQVLNDGDVAHFGFPLNSETNWVATQAREFRNRADIATFRVTIHCTNGQSITVKPEKPLLNFFHEQMLKHQAIR